MTHPNIVSSFQNDLNKISSWENMFNCDSYFKLDFKENVLPQDVFLVSK